MQSSSLLALLLLELLLAGCSAMQKRRLTPEVPLMSTPDSPLARLAGQARSDLALKLGLSPDQITISSAEAVDWPDSSLGCPQPGMAYSQIITPGYRIVLEASGKAYEYHAGRDGKVFFCESPVPPVPGGAGAT